MTEFFETVNEWKKMLLYCNIKKTFLVYFDLIVHFLFVNERLFVIHHLNCELQPEIVQHFCLIFEYYYLIPDTFGQKSVLVLQK